MIVMLAAIDPDMFVVVAVMIAIVVALARPGDDASGADGGDGEQQAADCYSSGVFHGVS
jgi:hypothetical protein